MLWYDDDDDDEIDKDEDCDYSNGDDDDDDTIRLLCNRLQHRSADKAVSSSCLASLFLMTSTTTLLSSLPPWV